MTDNQLAALISALTVLGGTLGAIVKWAVGRYEAITAAAALEKSMAAKLQAEQAALQTARIELALNNNTNAMLEHVRAAARLEVKVDSVADWVEQHTPIHGMPAYEEQQPPRRATPARGVTASEYSIGKGRP